MPLGPGKYGNLAASARDQTDAAAAIVMIIDGVDGSGFSIVGHISPHILVKILRSMADQIEQS
jgi:D-alanyl-D-alanine carboxypeptidase